MSRAFAIALTSAFLLIACASTPTVYGPVGKDGVGYSETRIESNRLRVAFEGGKDASRTQVEAFALRRAAELTLEQGDDWFRVIGRETDKLGQDGGSRPSVGVGASGGSGGHTSVGMGIGINLTPDSTRYVASLEVLTGKGQRPDHSDAYDARAVLSTSESQ